MKAIFIASERLGSIVETACLNLHSALLKRTRAMEFKRISRLLHDLRLIEKDQKVTALALGTDSSGQTGLLVLSETIKVEGSIQS